MSSTRAFHHEDDRDGGIEEQEPKKGQEPRRAGGGLVHGPWLRRVRPMLERMAAVDIPVLLLGETGVGKEVVADLLHGLSRRADQPLVRLNCAALPEQLLESELFGYERGAFTGAVKSKRGLLEVADGGTVFLDEVAEMPLPTQAKLLRVIEQGVLMRLGDLRERPVNVRYIAATNRDIPTEVAAGRFRNDLLYRLNAFTLRIPPLRARRGEIEPLVLHLVRTAAERHGRPEPAVSAEALSRLIHHEWPGNVRELKNAVDRAVVLCDGTIEVVHLPPQLGGRSGATDLSVVLPPPRPERVDRDDDERRERLESGIQCIKRPADEDEASELDRIMDALNQCGGNQTRAARMLGISRRTLISRLDRYNLPRPRKETG